jgi:hypothetical protein
MQKLTILLAAAIVVLEPNVVAHQHQSIRTKQEAMSDAPSNTPVVMMAMSDAPSATPTANNIKEPPGEKSQKGDMMMMMTMAPRVPVSGMMMTMAPKAAVSKHAKGTATASPTVGIVLPDPEIGMMGMEKGAKEPKAEKTIIAVPKGMMGMEKGEKEPKADKKDKATKVPKGMMMTPKDDFRK